jgi:cell division septum initiation protein DivIVA
MTQAMTDDDLLAMQHEGEGSGFDVVLRGYDRRQVEDYIHRVELTLGDADRLHQEDGERILALEEELAKVRLALGESQRRAEGLPDPASLVGERLATMLRLAEQEAEEIVEKAQEKAAKSTAERNAELSAREAAIADAGQAADRTRMEAQRDAQALRDKTQQDADDLLRRTQEQVDELLASASEEAERRRRTAEEDIAILHEDARTRADETLARAQAQVDDLARQRDTIAAQLEDLRRTLAAAMKPLGTGE